MIDADLLSTSDAEGNPAIRQATRQERAEKRYTSTLPVVRSKTMSPPFAFRERVVYEQDAVFNESAGIGSGSEVVTYVTKVKEVQFEVVRYSRIPRTIPRTVS